MTDKMSTGFPRKKALVTGATGFVGSHLVRRITAEGWEPHLIIRNDSDTSILGDVVGHVVLHRYGGSTEEMKRIAENAQPDVVFHLASLFLAHHGTSDVEPLIRSNILFATQLVDAMVQTRSYRLVNTGTSWQHFEDKDYSPVCLYAATKAAFESILQYYLETHPLRVITLKLYDTYGPRDPRPKLFSLLGNVAKNQRPLPMSPGDQKIDLVYIDDVVDAYLLAAERLMKADMGDGVHERYALSSGQPVTLKDLVKLYEQVAGRPLPIVWGGRPYRPREVMVPWSTGISLPGWVPKISLEAGIRKVISSMRGS